MKRNESEKIRNGKPIWYIAQLLIAFIFIIGGFRFFRWMYGDTYPVIDNPFILLIFLACFLLVINIHELGHFLAGSMMGYRLISYRILFLAFIRENDRIRLRFIPNMRYGGVCSMLPSGKEIPISRTGWFYAGGIVANVITGLCCLALSTPAAGLSGTWIWFMFFIALISLSSAAVNFLPFTPGNHPTDGKIIWAMLLHDPWSEKYIRLHQTVSQLGSGVRPRDLELPCKPDLENPCYYDLLLLLYWYFRALDSRNREETVDLARRIEALFSQYSVLTQPAVCYELCFTGCVTGDAAMAKEYYRKAGRHLQQDRDANGLRIKAYYEFYILENQATARKLCDRALSVAHLFPIRGQAVMERELVRSLERKIAEGEPLFHMPVSDERRGSCPCWNC